MLSPAEKEDFIKLLNERLKYYNIEYKDDYIITLPVMYCPQTFNPIYTFDIHLFKIEQFISLKEYYPINKLSSFFHEIVMEAFTIASINKHFIIYKCRFRYINLNTNKHLYLIDEIEV